MIPGCYLQPSLSVGFMVVCRTLFLKKQSLIIPNISYKMKYKKMSNECTCETAAGELPNGLQEPEGIKINKAKSREREAQKGATGREQRANLGLSGERRGSLAV